MVNEFPTLKLLIGVPGSGKSTYCENYQKEHPNSIWISSDKVRGLLLGNENDQSQNERIFEEMFRRTLDSLNQGYTVLYDATNVVRKRRVELLNKLPAYVVKEAIVCWAPVELCVERDTNRDRTVGYSVIDKMLKNFQAPYFDEGFDRIYIVRNVEDYENTYAKTFVRDYLQIDIEQDNFHHRLSLQGHMIAAMNYIRNKGIVDNQIELAARLHDIGKLKTKTFQNTKGEKTDTAHYYGHQGYGAWMSYGCKDITNRVAWLISTHMEPYFNSKYYRNLPEFLKSQINLIHEADVAAH